MSATTKPKPKPRSRVTRSFSLKTPVFQALVRRAKELERSPNWIVNELVRVGTMPAKGK